MSVIHWLLNICCFTLALPLGRPTALGVAHVDRLSLWETGPITLVYFYWVASRSMKVGKFFLLRAQRSRFTPVRRLAEAATFENRKLHGWKGVLLVTTTAVVPVLGLWLAIGLATACYKQALTKAAWLIAVSSSASVVVPQLLLSQTLPSADGLQPALEIASYAVVGSILLIQTYRLTRMCRFRGRTTSVAPPTSPV